MASIQDHKPLFAGLHPGRDRGVSSYDRWSAGWSGGVRCGSVRGRVHESQAVLEAVAGRAKQDILAVQASSAHWPSSPLAWRSAPRRSRCARAALRTVARKMDAPTAPTAGRT